MATFYVARSEIITPLPWLTFALPLTGGLGDIAIRYGYQRFETATMLAVVAVLIALVCGIQWIGDRLVTRLAHRG